MWNALRVELAKWRRTWFLLVTVGAALSGTVLAFLAFRTRAGEAAWGQVMQQVLMFFLMMTGPLIATLIGGQLIAAEYQWDTWKLSLTAPLPRWTIYLAKWLVSTGWLLGLSVLAYATAWLSGLLLHAGGPLDGLLWAKAYLLGGLGLSAMVPFYHLISLVFRNFYVTSGVGIVGTFTGIVVLNSKYIGLYPVSGNLALIQELLGRGAAGPGVLGTPAVWAAIEAGSAVAGLLASLLYVAKADYR